MQGYDIFDVWSNIKDNKITNFTDFFGNFVVFLTNKNGFRLFVYTICKTLYRKSAAKTNKQTKKQANKQKQKQRQKTKQTNKQINKQINKQNL